MGGRPLPDEPESVSARLAELIRELIVTGSVQGQAQLARAFTLTPFLKRG